jgi:hypothetical protein
MQNYLKVSLKKYERLYKLYINEGISVAKSEKNSKPKDF